MPAIYLTESDVERVLSMETTLEAVTDVFRRHALSEVANIPRGRARTDQVMLHLMGAAAKTLDLAATKTYTSAKGRVRFLVHLFHGRTGELLAVIEADELGAIRTGAVTGVATRLMARADADTVGVFGSGKQARTQLEAVCEVRDIVEAYVYSPRPERREAFAHEMSAELGIEVKPVPRPELAAEDKDILITATTSAEPVLKSEWIEPGTHINAIGSNFAGKSEIDFETIRRCDPIVVDDKEQCRIEAGDLIRATENGVVRWADIVDLGTVLVKRAPGRHRADDVTLFKSVGVAYADLAAAKVVYEQALAEGLGLPLPF